MHRKVYGLLWTWGAILIFYGVGWLTDRLMRGFNDSYTFLFFTSAILLALLFSSVVLFVMVLPQALCVRWLMRRFHLPAFAPLPSFFILSSAAVLGVSLLPGLKPLNLYLVGTPFVMVPCCILWWISFRTPRVAGPAAPERKGNNIGTQVNFLCFPMSG